MLEIKYQEKNYPVQRIIAQYENPNNDTAVIFIGGMHGNEASGYVALQNVMKALKPIAPKFKGNVYALGGNLQAMAKYKRYINEDLNRIWLHKNIDRINSGELNPSTAKDDELEFFELFTIIKEILNKHKEVFVLDLHTTSAPSIPFITINDMLINRKFSLDYPLPIIIGIEEYLKGPLLSFMNEFGFVSMAFEAGQHDSPKSLIIHESFVWLSLNFANILPKKDIPEYQKHYTRLKNQTDISKEIFEVRYRKDLAGITDFVMNPGYANFHPIEADEILAEDNSGKIKSIETGRIFMPLYQKQGSDGFFIIRKVPNWALKLSAILRKTNFDSLLTILPGIRRGRSNKHQLVINKKIAKYLSKELLHLLGYRRKVERDTLMIFSKREIKQNDTDPFG